VLSPTAPRTNADRVDGSVALTLGAVRVGWGPLARRPGSAIVAFPASTLRASSLLAGSSFHAVVCSSLDDEEGGSTVSTTTPAVSSNSPMTLGRGLSLAYATSAAIAFHTAQAPITPPISSTPRSVALVTRRPRRCIAGTSRDRPPPGYRPGAQAQIFPFSDDTATAGEHRFA
jgi:hypothetical protein